jgi:hypothetical protein
MKSLKVIVLLFTFINISVSAFSQNANEYYKGIWRGFGYFTDDYNQGNWDNDDYAKLQTVIEPVEDSILMFKTNNNRFNYAYLKTIKGQEYMIVEIKRRFRSNHYHTFKINRTGDNQFEAHSMINFTKKMRINDLNDMYYYILNNGKDDRVYEKVKNTLKRVSNVNQYDCVDCYH